MVEQLKKVDEKTPIPLPPPEAEPKTEEKKEVEPPKEEVKG